MLTNDNSDIIAFNKAAITRAQERFGNLLDVKMTYYSVEDISSFLIANGLSCSRCRIAPVGFPMLLMAKLSPEAVCTTCHFKKFV